MPTRYSRWVPASVVLGLLLATSGALFNTKTAYSAGLKIQRISIESTPSGAVVTTIVGRRGVTPLNITERDIYPNTYPDEKLELYGKVIISKPGCRTVTQGVTLDDIKQGLDVQLDCTEPAAIVKSEAAGKTKTIKKTELSATSTAEPLSDRRLRQLKVLNELLDDKLITAEEERTIRKRIFERLNQ